MNQLRLGRTELLVTPMAYAGIVSMNETPTTAAAYVDHAVANGINYFDIAPSYGNAEERTGPALRRHRDRIYLACKSAERSAAAMKRELLASLKRLQTDYFDVYQLHALSTQEDLDILFGEGGGMETIAWARQEGLIRFVGCSMHSEEIGLEACRRYDFDTVLFPMNWALGLNCGWGRRIAAVCRESDKGLLAMKTLVWRRWREGEPRVYPKSWCRPIFDNDRLALLGMKYGFHMGAQILVPPGNFDSSNLMWKHLEAAQEPLTDEELGYLRYEAEAVRDEMIFSPGI